MVKITALPREIPLFVEVYRGKFAFTGISLFYELKLRDLAGQQITDSSMDKFFFLIHDMTWEYFRKLGELAWNDPLVKHMVL